MHNNISINTIHKLEKAKEYWNLLSPHNSIDDEWDFRYAFYKYLQYKLNFVVVFNDNNPVALLPLQENNNKDLIPKCYDSKKTFLEFFGGDDMDNNYPFFSDGYEFLSQFLIDNLPGEAILAPLSKPISHKYASFCYTHKYTANLTGIDSIETFLAKNFSGKSKQKLLNKVNKIKRLFSIEMYDGSFGDLSYLFDYNHKRFGDKSSFRWIYRQQIFLDLMKIYPVDLFVISLNGIIKAVSFSIMYNNVYYSMNIGYDYKIRDLGKLVIITQIQRAIERKCILYDAGKGNNGWKEQFNLHKTPQYMQKIQNFSHTTSSEVLRDF